MSKPKRRTLNMKKLLWTIPIVLAFVGCYKVEVTYTITVSNSKTLAPEPGVVIWFVDQTSISDAAGQAVFVFDREDTREYKLAKEGFEDRGRMIDMNATVEDPGGVTAAVTQEKRGYTDKAFFFYIYDTIKPME
jgi:hypothetical protein